MRQFEGPSLKLAMLPSRLESFGARAEVWGPAQTLPRPSDQPDLLAPRLWGSVVSPAHLPATMRTATDHTAKHSGSPRASPRPAFPLNPIHNTLILTMAPRLLSAQLSHSHRHHPYELPNHTHAHALQQVCQDSPPEGAPPSPNSADTDDSTTEPLYTKRLPPTDPAPLSEFYTTPSTSPFLGAMRRMHVQSGYSTGRNSQQPSRAPSPGALELPPAMSLPKRAYSTDAITCPPPLGSRHRIGALLSGPPTPSLTSGATSPLGRQTGAVPHTPGPRSIASSGSSGSSSIQVMKPPSRSPNLALLQNSRFPPPPRPSQPSTATPSENSRSPSPLHAGGAGTTSAQPSPVACQSDAATRHPRSPATSSFISTYSPSHSNLAHSLRVAFGMTPITRSDQLYQQKASAATSERIAYSQSHGYGLVGPYGPRNVGFGSSAIRGAGSIGSGRHSDYSSRPPSPPITLAPLKDAADNANERITLPKLRGLHPQYNDFGDELMDLDK
jgi:zinc finger protein CreA/MIG